MAINPTILAGIMGFLGTLFLGFLYLTLWTWRHSASLGGEDEERVVELESHLKSQVDDELTNLYIRIEELADEAEGLPEEMSKDEQVANIIHREIGREDIAPIVESLDEVDNPEELFDSHRTQYRDASRDFGWSGLGALTLGGLISGVTVLQGGSPFSQAWPFLYFVIVILILLKGHDGVKKFLAAQNRKDEFEGLWRKYKRLE